MSIKQNGDLTPIHENLLKNTNYSEIIDFLWRVKPEAMGDQHIKAELIAFFSNLDKPN